MHTKLGNQRALKWRRWFDLVSRVSSKLQHHMTHPFVSIEGYFEDHSSKLLQNHKFPADFY